MFDQILGVGGLSALVYLSWRLGAALREGWRSQKADLELERQRVSSKR